MASWSEVCAGLESAPPRLESLTPAERIVAHYVSLGLSNREIARVLGKAEATVKHQVGACLQKCGVPTRGRLIVLLR